MPFTYDYPRPALTVDCVIFGFDAAPPLRGEGDLKVALIRRTLEPFKNRWALPGGFVHIEETLEAAALRELSEETGLTNVYLEQLYTFGSPNRDPRGRTVSVAYYALVSLHGRPLTASTDAAEVAWFSIDDFPTLAFDHADILEMAITRLRTKVRYAPLGFELLPPRFTLSQLQHLYQTILGRDLDKRNFRKKLLAMDILKETDEIQQDVSHRAARLYEFDEPKYKKLLKKGFHFEI